MSQQQLWRNLGHNSFVGRGVPTNNVLGIFSFSCGNTVPLVSEKLHKYRYTYILYIYICSRYVYVYHHSSYWALDHFHPKSHQILSLFLYCNMPVVGVVNSALILKCQEWTGLLKWIQSSQKICLSSYMNPCPPSCAIKRFESTTAFP